MLYHLKEYRKFVEITGYRNVKFSVAEAFLKACRVQTSLDVEIQFFDAEVVATWEHLYFAVLNALLAFKNKTNLSKSLAMETMIYASAQRQIQKAIQRCGIKPTTTSIAVVVISDSAKKVKIALANLVSFLGGYVDESILEMSEDKEKKIKQAFQVSGEEIKTVQKDGNSQAALINLVIERLALLATQL